MATVTYRQRRGSEIWPGFVDALAALLMVIIFLVMIFVLAQFFLNEALSGRDAALQRLQSRANELADLLALERRANDDLRLDVAQLAEELQASVTLRDDLNATVETLTIRAEAAETRADRMNRELENAFETMMADKGRIETQGTEIATLAGQVAALQALKKNLESEIAGLADKLQKSETDFERSRAALEQARVDLEKNAGTMMADKNRIELQVAEITKLAGQVAALQALKQSLESEIAGLADKLRESETGLEKSRADLEKTSADRDSSNASLIKEREISESARAQVALLNRQMAALRNQLGKLSAILEASEKLAQKQKIQIASLGQRLNTALAAKVQELSRYRSEFFGRLREVLGDHSGIRVVGDRFVFQSEVLFATGSAELGEAGKTQLARLAATLGELSRSIPPEINWVLRIDGHTDRVLISTPKYPSNWELSTDRAISVVKFLVDEGIPADRLAATGFGKHQPIDLRDDEIAYRRNRRIELKLDQR